jgi:integrase
MLQNDIKKRKTRSDKFPLTLHPTGQFCKKVRGKLYYFGSDKKPALQRYLEQAAYLHSGKAVPPDKDTEDLSIRYLCNLYLEHQQTRALVGQIKTRHLYDQTVLLRDFVRFVGPNRAISDISTMELQNYVRKQIRDKKSANTINNRIAAIKAMYNWALNNEIISDCPNLKAVKKITKIKQDKFTFSMPQIQKLLDVADVQIKAMILLGLNCGFGCTDCAELKWDNLDLAKSRVIFPRGKTGISRNLTLWPETVQALKGSPKKGELVFYTAKGNPWVWATQTVDRFGNERFTKEDALSRKFSKLLKKAGIKTEKGVGFYTLRRTAATLAARSGDPFAVQRLLGHADLKMASVYVQDVSEQTDRVVNNMRKLIIQDDSSPDINAATDVKK